MTCCPSKCSFTDQQRGHILKDGGKNRFNLVIETGDILGGKEKIIFDIFQRTVLYVKILIN